METLKRIVGIFLAAALVAVSPGALADGTNSVAPAKPKPDLLKTCPVSGDKLGGDMGKPYVFVYDGQEVKLCCPMCKKDFDKEPAKYIKLIRAADKTKDKPQS
jgi:YHS domain-containing protein